MSEMKHTAWRVRYAEMHGRRYGLRDVATVDEDHMLVIEGSGGARCYTDSVCTFPGSTDDERHARLIAAAPDLRDCLEEIIDYRGGAANALEDEYVMERVHAALEKATEP